MRKACFIFFFLLSQYSYAQKDSLTAAEKLMLDSLIANDPFLQLLSNQKQKDNIYLSLGAGNGGFSTHNNAANATGYVKQLIIMPAVNFYSAKGINAGITGFITNDDTRKDDLYQLGITLGYGYEGKKINTGISYTRYVRTGSEYNSRSLYQNDLYGYIKKAKGWLRPGLSAGFVSGTYKEWDWLTYERTVHLPNPPPFGRDTVLRLRTKDSTKNQTNYFSLTAEVRHKYSFYEVFSKKDAFGFTPALMVNFGSANLTQAHTSAIFERSRILSRYKKSELSDRFQVQSIALSLDGLFTIDHFFLQPNLYFDYYLPATTHKRFSSIFSVAAGFYF